MNSLRLSIACLALILSGCNFFGNESSTPLEGKRLAVEAPKESLVRWPVQSSKKAALHPESLPCVYQQGIRSTHQAVNASFGLPVKLTWMAALQGTKPYHPLVGPLMDENYLYLMGPDSTFLKISRGDPQVRHMTTLDSPESAKWPMDLGGGAALDSSLGIVVVTTPGSEVVALRQDTLDILWRAPLGAAMRHGPALWQGKAYIVTLNHAVVAFDVATGRILWRHKGLNTAAVKLGGVKPAVNEEAVISVTPLGEAVALHPATGTLLWAYPIVERDVRQDVTYPVNRIMHPVIMGDHVFVGYNDTVAVLKLKNGEVVWSRRAAFVDTPAVSQGIGWAVDQNNLLLCFDIKKGHLFWKAPLGKGAWFSPVLAGGHLYVAAHHGLVKVIDALTGKEKTGFMLPAPILVPPVIIDGAMAVMGQERLMFVQDSKN